MQACHWAEKCRWARLPHQPPPSLSILPELPTTFPRFLQQGEHLEQRDAGYEAVPAGALPEQREAFVLTFAEGRNTGPPWALHVQLLPAHGQAGYPAGWHLGYRGILLHASIQACRLACCLYRRCPYVACPRLCKHVHTLAITVLACVHKKKSSCKFATFRHFALTGRSW